MIVRKETVSGLWQEEMNFLTRHPCVANEDHLSHKAGYEFHGTIGGACLLADCLYALPLGSQYNLSKNVISADGARIKVMLFLFRKSGLVE